MKKLLDITTGWIAIITVLVPLACQAAAPMPLVNHSDTWRYLKGTTEPPADWKSATDSMLDASWLSGNGGLGYADNAFEVTEVRTTLADMKGRYTTVFLRRSFDFPSAVDPTLHLVLNMDWDDGFIAWLDGVYLTSANSPGAPAQPSHTALATGDHESSRGNNSPNEAVLYDLGEVGSRLPTGPHVLSNMSGVGLLLSFAAESNRTYAVSYRDSLVGLAWSNLVSFSAAPTNRIIKWNDSTFTNLTERFYRLETP